jgi:tRNA threonylcarbamoyladenosine biosynthesis protein TsaB
MNLLSLDTSTTMCAIALRAGERAFCETVVAGNTHSQLALPMIEALMARAGIGFGQLDAVAFGSGPGSFTGVRIACAIAQGLAFAHGKQVVPVSTLASIAYTCGAVSPDFTHIWVANDARMSEVYCAGYVKNTSGAWAEAMPVRVCAPADAAPPRGSDWVLAGDALAAYPEIQIPSHPNETSGLMQASQPIPSPSKGAHLADKGWGWVKASQIIQLTAEGLLAASEAAFHVGCAIHPRDAEPLYVRNNVARTEAERALDRAQKAKAAA